MGNVVKCLKHLSIETLNKSIISLNLLSRLDLLEQLSNF